MTRIKLCGFTREADVAAAVAAGVDALGFNFARGPRRITPELGRTLVARVPPYVQTVALFVDADETTIRAVLRATRCGSVQLHGAEPPELAARLRADLPVVKAARIATRADLERLRGYPADAFLLDAYVPGSHGGTGHAWDHALLGGIDLGAPVILAGGLSPTTVAMAVRTTRPWAVDAASGVESAPGIKDAGLITAFVAAVRSAPAAAVD
jgi:phosphoribosylanthranilate isomerase